MIIFLSLKLKIETEKTVSLANYFQLIQSLFRNMYVNVYWFRVECIIAARVIHG